MNRYQKTINKLVEYDMERWTDKGRSISRTRARRIVRSEVRCRRYINWKPVSWLDGNKMAELIVKVMKVNKRSKDKPVTYTEYKKLIDKSK